MKGVSGRLRLLGYSRRQEDGKVTNIGRYIHLLDNECKDVDKVRIQSLDVAPDGARVSI